MDDDYRNDFKTVKKEFTWTFWQVFPLLLLLFILLSGIGFVLSSLVVFGATTVERKVFEASYQRQEAIESQIATDEAVLEEIRAQLADPNLDPNIRTTLEAQAAAARVRIKIAEKRRK